MLHKELIDKLIDIGKEEAKKGNNFTASIMFFLGAILPENKQETNYLSDVSAYLEYISAQVVDEEVENRNMLVSHILGSIATGEAKAGNNQLAGVLCLFIAALVNPDKAFMDKLANECGKLASEHVEHYLDKIKSSDQ